MNQASSQKPANVNQQLIMLTVYQPTLLANVVIGVIYTHFNDVQKTDLAFYSEFGSPVFAEQRSVKKKDSQIKTKEDKTEVQVQLWGPHK